MVEVRLAYRRDTDATTSTGCIVSDENTLVTEEHAFEQLDFKKMLVELSRVLANWPEETEVKVSIQRTDHQGLLPYVLDARTVVLLRTDPVAAVAALSLPMDSPSDIVKRVIENRTPLVTPPIRVGHAVMSDAFGEHVYFRVRRHELECPGCGFWGMYAIPALLNSEERAGEEFKTAFVCPKKCKERFIVSCLEVWGYVRVEDLLKSKLNSFYLPRAWNTNKPWVSRATLQQLYNEYKEESERACSKALSQ